MVHYPTWASIRRSEEVKQQDATGPETFTLSQNYPNCLLRNTCLPPRQYRSQRTKSEPPSNRRSLLPNGTSALPIRHLTLGHVPEPISFLCCDASFIGLKVVLPASMELVSEGGHLIALIKPQFEVGKGNLGKRGVVSDSDLHKSVCSNILDWLSSYPGWSVLGITDSPITGAEGNKEFLKDYKERTWELSVAEDGSYWLNS